MTNIKRYSLKHSTMYLAKLVIYIAVYLEYRENEKDCGIFTCWI